jgi:hypothetical protein
MHTPASPKNSRTPIEATKTLRLPLRIDYVPLRGEISDSQISSSRESHSLDCIDRKIGPSDLKIFVLASTLGRIHDGVIFPSFSGIER